MLFDILFGKRRDIFKNGICTKLILLTFWSFVAYYLGLKVFKGVLTKISIPETNFVLPFSNSKELADNLRYIPTTFTCNQYAHHVMMDIFKNANTTSKNKDMREWNTR